MSRMAPRKATLRRETDPDKIKPTGVMLNRRDLRDFKPLAQAYKDAESLYLRENEFVEFDPYITLERLKMLDLSMNLVTGTVNFLPKTPILRHLYMTSNRIESLFGIMGLRTLETLCLSDNQIETFEGLDALPNLRVLSLNYNRIGSFQQFPHLPQLHTLNLVGNPITGVDSYRGMTIALTTQNLVSIDGKLVEGEERAAVSHYRGKVVFCIAEGFIIEGDNVEEAADKFLLDFQRYSNEGQPLTLQGVRLTAAETGSNLLHEAVPVKLNLCMQDVRDYEARTTLPFYSRDFFPVVFKASGDATEAFVVGSMNDWTDPIPLERCEVDGEIIFHTTLYLPAGDYEYRYIIDGQERTSDEHRVQSQYKQGECNLYHVTAPEIEEDTDNNSVLYIRWMRGDDNNGFVLIPNENSLNYTPTSDDIGYCLRAEVLVYVNGDFAFQYFDISTPVSAGHPYCDALSIKGEPAEGSVLTVDASYKGGQEGESGLAWYRVSPDGFEIPLELADPWAGYIVSLEDIGYRIKAVFTPVRNDWVAGEPISELTPIIAAGVPNCREIKIIGEPLEGQPLTVEAIYAGGMEGESVYQWYRHDERTDEFFALRGETRKTFTPSLEDVGKVVAVEYTPINREGVEGEGCRCVLDKTVDAAEPQLLSLGISGDAEESHVLQAQMEYFGGYFGSHQIQWQRREKGKVVKIGKANSPTLSLTSKEVGSTIEVVVNPVRSDGIVGTAYTAATTETVRPGFPQLQSLEINGEKVPDGTLTIEAEYFGGAAGEPVIEWARSSETSRDFEVVARNTLEYTVSSKDAGHMLKVSYTPTRKDGVLGETKNRLVEIGAKGRGSNFNAEGVTDVQSDDEEGPKGGDAEPSEEAMLREAEEAEAAAVSSGAA